MATTSMLYQSNLPSSKLATVEKQPSFPAPESSIIKAGNSVVLRRPSAALTRNVAPTTPPETRYVNVVSDVTSAFQPMGQQHAPHQHIMNDPMRKLEMNRQSYRDYSDVIPAKKASQSDLYVAPHLRARANEQVKQPSLVPPGYENFKPSQSMAQAYLSPEVWGRYGRVGEKQPLMPLQPDAGLYRPANFVERPGAPRNSEMSYAVSECGSVGRGKFKMAIILFLCVWNILVYN